MPVSSDGRGQVIMSLVRGKETKSVSWPEVPLPAWEPLSPRALRYLAKRGIDKDTASRLGIVEMASSMRVLVPFRGPSGEIIYWTARSYSKLEEGPKYMSASGKHPLYVLPGWGKHDCLVLVEGVFDAIAVQAATGLAVAGLCGKALGHYLRSDVLGLAGGTVVVLLDGDAVGDAMVIKRHLSTAGRRVVVKLLDIGQDPSSTSPDELRRLLL